MQNTTRFCLSDFHTLLLPRTTFDTSHQLLTSLETNEEGVEGTEGGGHLSAGHLSKGGGSSITGRYVKFYNVYFV